MVNSTISGNTTGPRGGGGGGVIITSGSLTATNATICGNEAEYGGGLHVGRSAGTITVNGSIIVGNRANTGKGDDYFVNKVLAGAYSVVGPWSGRQQKWPSENNTILDEHTPWTDVLENDGTSPILQDNGGPVPTVAILPSGSAYARIQVSPGFTVPLADARGVLRGQGPNGESCAGAYEIPSAANRLAISTTSLPDATQYANYTGAVAGTGGVPARYSFSIKSGALPAGLTLEEDGTFSGAPKATGTFDFTVRLTDGAQIADKALSLTVNPVAGPGPAPAPDPNPAPSDNTTPSGVSLTIGGTRYPAEKQPDGTLLITVPSGTDVSNLTIGGTLPAGASSNPKLPASHDFTTGPLTITVTAQDGRTKATYTIDVKVESPPAPTEKPLFSIRSADCEIIVTENADGTRGVKVRIPFALGSNPALLDTVRMIANSLGLSNISYSIVNADGSETPVDTRQSPRMAAKALYLQIAGTAANMHAVKNGAIEKIEYTLKGDGTTYVQTFANGGLKVAGMPGYPSPTPSPSTGGSSSGCNAGVFGAFGLMLCGAYLWRKRG